MTKNKYISSLELIEMDKLLAMDMLFFIMITHSWEKFKKMNSKEKEFLRPKIIKLIKATGKIGN